MSIADLIESACEEWAEPRAIDASGLRLRCSMEPAIGLVTIDRATPPELADLWKRVHAAHLFEDVDYGQWGLELVSPHESARASGAFRRARAGDRMNSDVVVGRFAAKGAKFWVETNRT